MSILPKHWKDEHVIACLVRNMMIIDNEVIQSELDWMAKTSEDYAVQGIDVPGVWDSVDDEILEIAKTPGNYPKLVADAITYVNQNFDHNNKQVLIYYLTNMAAQDDVVNYPEYLSLKQVIDSCFPGQEDIMLNDLKKDGIKVITNDPTLESNTKTIQQLVVLPDGKSVDLWDTKYWNLGAISYPMDDKEMIDRLVEPFSDPSNSHILLYPIDVLSSPHLQYFAYAGKAHKYIEAWKNASRTGNFKTKIYLFDMITEYYYSQEIDHGEFGDGYFVDDVEDEYREDQFEENIPDSITGKYQLLRDLGLIEFKERFKCYYTEEWSIIHDIGVFYMFFANLADGFMKKPEQDFIDEMLPKWQFRIDGIDYGFIHKNPSDLNSTMSDIFNYLYGKDGKGNPTWKVGASQENLLMYFNNGKGNEGSGSFTLSNIQTFLDMLYNLCLADGTISTDQKNNLSNCCKHWQSLSGYAATILEKLDGKTIDEMLENTEFDAEGKPIEKTDFIDDADVSKETEDSNADAINLQSVETSDDPEELKQQVNIGGEKPEQPADITAQNTSDQDSSKSKENETWNIIHEIGVFYMYFANLSDHPDGALKNEEVDFISKALPKWEFGIDGVNYGLKHGNPSDIQVVMDTIFNEMYGDGDPMPKVNESHRSIIEYINNGSFTANNLKTLLSTLYDLCMADGTISEGQKHQLTYYCEQFKPGCDFADVILERLDENKFLEQIDEKFNTTEFDAEGKPIGKTDHIDDTDVSNETDDPSADVIDSKPVETPDDPVESFRNFMASQIDGMKLPKNKPYGSLPLGQGFQIGFHARKDHLAIQFRSDKIKANKVFNWINKKGLMGKNIADDYILQPMPGKKNPNVVTAELNIPYNSKDELSKNDLRNKAIELFNILKGEFKDIGSSF